MSQGNISYALDKPEMVSIADRCFNSHSARENLRRLTVRLGEKPCVRCGDSEPAGCDQNHFKGLRFIQQREQGERDLTIFFLNKLLQTLTSAKFARLSQVTLGGFRVVELGISRLMFSPEPKWHLLDACPFLDISSIRRPNVDHRWAWQGFEDTLSAQEWAECEDALDIA